MAVLYLLVHFYLFGVSSGGSLVYWNVPLFEESGVLVIHFCFYFCRFGVFLMREKKVNLLSYKCAFCLDD